jgi:DNA-binding CsgD family transcriptional regulator
MDFEFGAREVDTEQSRRILETLPGLTGKQHEVLELVAENRTSKEIAWELGISESAVNQRIEGVRARTGSPPRAELARVYRYFQRQASSPAAFAAARDTNVTGVTDVKPVTRATDMDAGEQSDTQVALGADTEAACNPVPEKNPQVPSAPSAADEWRRDEPGDRLTLSDGVTFRVAAPWQDEPVERVVPEVLDGPDAGINRVAAMVLIAGGLLLVAVFGLDLATALSRLS